MSFYKPFQTKQPGSFGDLKKTGIINILFKVPYEERDEEWKKEYFPNIADALLAPGLPQIIEGPDGYPYFHLEVPEIDTSFQGFTIKQLSQDFLFQEGVGLAINPAKEIPDWVFSYGDIMNFMVSGEFYSQSNDWISENDIPTDAQVSYSEPDEKIIPEQTRQVLKKYLQDYKVLAPEFLLKTIAIDGRTKKQLVFKIPPDLFRHESVHEDVVNSLSWFLPKHYTFFWSIDENLNKHFVLI